HAQDARRAGPRAATAPPERNASVPGTAMPWYASVHMRIEREKRYPPHVLPRGQSATVRLTFAIDRAGRLVESRIARSSGYPELDQAAVEALQRAQPFPPPPADLPGETFEFAQPMTFRAPQPVKPGTPPAR